MVLWFFFFLIWNCWFLCFYCDVGVDVVNIILFVWIKINDWLSGVLKGVGFYIKKGSMLEEEVEGLI